MLNSMKVRKSPVLGQLVPMTSLPGARWPGEFDCKTLVQGRFTELGSSKGLGSPDQKERDQDTCRYVAIKVWGRYIHCRYVGIGTCVLNIDR